MTTFPNVAGGRKMFAEGRNEVAPLFKQSLEEQGESQVEQGFVTILNQDSCPQASVSIAVGHCGTLLAFSKAFLFNLLFMQSPPEGIMFLTGSKLGEM